MAPVPAAQAASVAASQCMDPPVCTLPAIPAPPSTIIAPVVAEVAAVVPLMCAAAHSTAARTAVPGNICKCSLDGPTLDDE